MTKTAPQFPVTLHEYRVLVPFEPTSENVRDISIAIRDQFDISSVIVMATGESTTFDDFTPKSLRQEGATA